jgi:hypothetical protein
MEKLAPGGSNGKEAGGGLGVVVRATRQVAGGAVTVVGSVGYTAGDALEGAGDVLNATAETVGGTVVLLGDVLDSIGRLGARVLTGVGTALTLAGRMIDGRASPFSPTRPPATKPPSASPAPATKAPAKKAAKKSPAGAKSEMEKMGAPATPTID